MTIAPRTFSRRSSHQIERSGIRSPRSSGRRPPPSRSPQRNRKTGVGVVKKKIKLRFPSPDAIEDAWQREATRVAIAKASTRARTGQRHCGTPVSTLTNGQHGRPRAHWPICQQAPKTCLFDRIR